MASILVDNPVEAKLIIVVLHIYCDKYNRRKKFTLIVEEMKN